MSTLHEDKYTFMVICHLVLPRMTNVSDKSSRENQNTHFMVNKFFFLKSCHLWGNVEKYGRARQARDGNMVHVLCSLIS